MFADCSWLFVKNRSTVPLMFLNILQFKKPCLYPR